MAAAWAILQHLGEAGYLDLVKRMYRAKARLIDGITSIPGMYILGAPESNVFTFTSDSYDVYAVAEMMEKQGWFLFRILAPRALHIQCDPFDDEMVDTVLAAMRASVDRVVKNGLQSGSDKTGYR
jgi:glutamate/tyrosine decarboxylase-like PLP-dependent enzyme